MLLLDCPPTTIAYFAERVILHEGVLRDPDVDYWDWSLNGGPGRQGGGGWRAPSTATGSIWLVWIKDGPRQPPMWIPPCRLQLTRPGDYPVNPDQRGVFIPPAAATLPTDCLSSFTNGCSESTFSA